MRPFSPAELARMQAVQEAAMQDTGELYAYTEVGSDEFGQPVREYELAGTTKCGLRLVTPREVKDRAEVVLIDAELRLPIDTNVAQVDRFVLTHRYGQACSLLEFEFVGPPLPGPSGLVAQLKRATDRRIVR